MVSSKQLVAKRRIEIKRGDKTWKVLNEIGQSEKEYVWDCLSEEDKYPEDETPYTCQLIITSLSGIESRSEPINIPIKKIYTERKKNNGGDSAFESYSLILFDYNRFDVSPKNEKIMNDYVYTRCFPNSSIYITGHTDVVGSNGHNLKLSQARSAIVQAGIKSYTKGAYGQLNVRGAGEDEPLYYNSLPEGRFYNRIVNVIIKTPYINTYVILLNKIVRAFEWPAVYCFGNSSFVSNFIQI